MPPVALTPKLVRTLPPGDHRDTVVQGLVLRVRPGGGRSFSVVYTRWRWNRRMTLGPLSDSFTLADARARAREILHRFRGGEDPAETRRRALLGADLTVERLVLGRLAAAKLRPSTAKEWQRIAASAIIPALGRRPAADLRRSDIRTWLQGFRSGWSANHAFEVLRWAYARGLELELVEHSPCVGVQKPHRGEASHRVLSTLETMALWRALEIIGTGLFADAARLLLLTGVRRAMVLGARREEFEDEAPGAALRGRLPPGATLGEPSISQHSTDARWTIPGGFAGRSKSGRPHVVPLSPQALAVVRRRLDQAPGEYLFPTLRVRRAGHVPAPHMRALPSAWVRTLKAATRWTLWRHRASRDELGPGSAAMERWKLHGLRHTIATHMTEDLGVHENVVSLILGHSLPGAAVSRVYNRAERLPERRAALVAWGAWVEGLAAGAGARVLPMSRR